MDLIEAELPEEFCLEQLIDTKKTVEQIFESIINEREKEIDERQKIKGFFEKLKTLKDEICKLENVFECNYPMKNDLSVDLIMELELDLTNQGVYLEGYESNQENVNRLDSANNNNQSMSAGMVNAFLVEECQNLILQIQECNVLNKALAMRKFELQSKYDSCMEDHDALKLKFEKLKQLTIKSRQEQRSAREKSNSERETYELCISQSNDKLIKSKEEIQNLKNSNTQLMNFIEQLENKIEQDKREHQDQLDTLKTNIDIKTEELEMSRQANEFLNDEHLNLKLTLKTIQQQQTSALEQNKELLEREIKNEFNERIMSLEQKLGEKEGELLKLTNDNDASTQSFQGEIIKLNSHLKQIKTQLKYMINENSSLKSEVESLKKQHSDSLSTAESFPLNETANVVSRVRKSDFNLNSILLQKNDSAGETTNIEPNFEVETNVDSVSAIPKAVDVKVESGEYMEILAQSENTSTLLQQQISVLQQEIRRLQNNQNRVESIKNMEYLKDMIIKFIKTSPEDKKCVVPLLSKTLVLNESEIDILYKFAELDVHFCTDSKSSWFSYLKPW